MENYQLGSELGSGSFGRVYRATHTTTGEVVAIKQLKKCYASWEECSRLREVQTLLSLNGHPNIIKVNHFIFEYNTFYFVFEYMTDDLLHIIQQRGEPFSEDTVRYCMMQILRAVEYMHKSGYIHRDLKPENVLVSKDGVLKVADLGMATEMGDGPPYTSRVGTRLYRAPEILLQSSNHGAFYGAPSDMWSVGVIMADLLTGSSLFKGHTDLDQVFRICEVLGAPNECSWPDGMEMAKAIHLRFPQAVPTTPLHLRLAGLSPEAINLVSALCSWDPKSRLTASSALEHPFFQTGQFLNDIVDF